MNKTNATMLVNNDVAAHGVNGEVWDLVMLNVWPHYSTLLGKFTSVGGE